MRYARYAARRLHTLTVEYHCPGNILSPSEHAAERNRIVEDAARIAGNHTAMEVDVKKIKRAIGKLLNEFKQQKDRPLTPIPVKEPKKLGAKSPTVQDSDKRKIAASKPAPRGMTPEFISPLSQEPESGLVPRYFPNLKRRNPWKTKANMIAAWALCKRRGDDRPDVDSDISTSSEDRFVDQSSALPPHAQFKMEQMEFEF